MSTNQRERLAAESVEELGKDRRQRASKRETHANREQRPVQCTNEDEKIS
jgi:hypothetical protein